ncbi:hypothetical protein Caci_8351 [Catenulispora acidiphila DSM 44928]|uniref:Uncharacterized protein n=1 Tax=Catenulispora acidiphila (strain DSM 44928 / JCM 14897 / NBRC 102108 / NRRL B-24433 / ID139908) TaxID=479433 RepID=C7PWR7_CATAD|nr:hypothetical protein [Catenulispora acidiphila]ACU77174.1 hypothetical protein Caci_8351 [Catenulispora acidiphila DSM 44928]
MTEFEDSADQGAEEDGSQTRELFARTAVQAYPRLAFTADDLVAEGRRRVRRRRMAAVVGSTASVAVVAVAAAAFAGGGGSGTAAVAPGASVTTSPRPALTTTDTAKQPLTDDERTLAERKLAAAVFAEVAGKLDPGGKHLTPSGVRVGKEDAFAPNTGVCVEKTKLQVSYGFNMDWTVTGQDPFPRHVDATSPYVDVSVEVFAPGKNVDQFGASQDWGPLTRTSLPDHSVVETGATAGGHRVQAVRTMGNGQQILVRALDGSTAPNVKTQPTNPFPYTAAQLGAIVGGVSLPLPFADGFQPHTSCNP